MKTQDTQHILDELQSLDQFSPQEALVTVRSKISQNSKKRARRRLYFMSGLCTSAAVVLLVFLLQFNTLSIVNDSDAVMTHLLPDGSSVELNKLAELKYKSDFDKGRNVRLSGEAFFDIVADASHPFIIKAGKSKIKVLGTSFNVRHNQQSDKVEVLVKTGTVLLSNDDRYSLELTATQLGVANNKQLKQIDQKDVNYMSWLNHKLIFVDNQLPYVIQTVENTYHTNITVTQVQLELLSISTTFHQLSLDEIITSICLTLNLDYEKTSSGYILSPK